MRAAEMPENIPVSVCIIAYNEEAKILRCLESVRQFGDVVLVVDSKSVDRTAAIGEDFGCRVFIEEWKGDGPQKQSAIDKCNFNWILMLDADEILPLPAFETIQSIFLNPADIVAYSMKRRSYIGERRIRHSGWWPDRVIRLFDRRYCRMRGITHSSLQVNGKTCPLDAVIEHYSYVDYAHLAEKMNRYSSWMANELYHSGRRVNVMTPMLHAIWMFVRVFFIKRGFLDGLDGITISTISATGSFLKYAKLLEIQRNMKKSVK
jgi:glycosyltransferase involved in cell wall biosynthesis